MKMKKMLTMVVAACTVAFAVNAASVKWTMNPGSDYNDWTGYIVSDTTTLASVLSTVLEETAAPKAWVDAVSPIAATGTIAGRGKAAGTIADVGSAKTYTLVLFDGEIAAGTKYAIFETFNVADYSYEGAQTPTAMTFSKIGSSGTLTAKGTTPPGPGGVPEPTSGLLLVLGGAALALRRKLK